MQGARGVVAAHLTVANLRPAPVQTPRFELTSGAETRDSAALERHERERARLPHLPDEVGRHAGVSGWLLCPLSARFEDGRPGYLIVADDVPGNWRGVYRPTQREPLQLQFQEAPPIANDLANWYYWGGVLLDETNATDVIYQRRREHWIEQPGGNEELARARLFAAHEKKYGTWEQLVVPYLRERVGTSYALQFEGEMDSTEPP